MLSRPTEIKLLQFYIARQKVNILTKSLQYQLL